MLKRLQAYAHSSLLSPSPPCCPLSPLAAPLVLGGPRAAERWRMCPVSLGAALSGLAPADPLGGRLLISFVGT